MVTEYDFEKLRVYQESLDLAEKIYEVTSTFPVSEQFGLTSQLRRAALSIPLNIAEGKGRYHTKVFVQFLYQARGSLYEVIALLKFGHRIKYLTKQAFEDLMHSVDQISSKLSNLIKTFKE